MSLSAVSLLLLVELESEPLAAELVELGFGFVPLDVGFVAVVVVLAVRPVCELDAPSRALVVQPEVVLLTVESIAPSRSTKRNNLLRLFFVTVLRNLEAPSIPIQRINHNQLYVSRVAR